MTPDTPRPASRRPETARANVRGEQTRGRLLDAALEAFSARGFHGTSTRDLALAAGMSPAAVYVHYRTKEELLFRLSLAGHTDVREVVTAALLRSSEPSGQAREVAHDFAMWHARFHTLARVVQYEMEALSPDHRAEIVAIRRSTERAVRGVVEAGTKTGEFTVLDAGVSALAVLSLGIDVARWYRPDAGWTPEQIGDHYAELSLRLLGHH